MVQLFHYIFTDSILLDSNFYFIHHILLLMSLCHNLLTRFDSNNHWYIATWCYCWTVKKYDVVRDTDEMKAKRLDVEEDLMKTSWGWDGPSSAWIEVEDDTDWILKLGQLVDMLTIMNMRSTHRPD